MNPFVKLSFAITLRTLFLHQVFKIDLTITHPHDFTLLHPSLLNPALVLMWSLHPHPYVWTSRTSSFTLNFQFRANPHVLFHVRHHIFVSLTCKLTLKLIHPYISIWPLFWCMCFTCRFQIRSQFHVTIPPTPLHCNLTQPQFQLSNHPHISISPSPSCFSFEMLAWVRMWTNLKCEVVNEIVYNVKFQIGPQHHLPSPLNFTYTLTVQTSFTPNVKIKVHENDVNRNEDNLFEFEYI